jgi:hypothetical protein
MKVKPCSSRLFDEALSDASSIPKLYSYLLTNMLLFIMHHKIHFSSDDKGLQALDVPCKSEPDCRFSSGTRFSLRSLLCGPNLDSLPDKPFIKLISSGSVLVGNLIF